MVKKLVFLIALCTTIGLGSYFAFQSFINEIMYSKLKKEYTEILNWEDRLLNFDTWFFPESEWKPKKEISYRKINDASMYHKSALKYFKLSILIFIVGTVIILFINYQNPLSIKNMSLTILLMSMVCLIFGVTSPMLEIEVYEDDMEIPIKFDQLREEISEGTVKVLTFIPFIEEEMVKPTVDDVLASVLRNRIHTIKGRQYFYYQNKSAAGVMNVLYKQGNYFVLTAITLFSFVIPFLKLIVSLILLFSKKLSDKLSIRKTIGYIGKLSMGDVFVASMYLSYMSFYSMNTGIETDSITLVGIYFFTIYVLLSIFSYFLLEKHLKSNYHGEIYSEKLG